MTNQQIKIKEGYKQTEVGAIPEDWEVRELVEVVEKFVNGGTPSTKNVNYWTGDIPWITGADLLNQKVAEVRRYITKEAVKSSSTNVISKGNLLLVSRTGVGKLAIAPCDIAISQDFTGIYPKNESLLAEYLFRFFDFNQYLLKSQNQGTSIQGITRETLSALSIPLPPTKAEQTAIATALSDADALIQSMEKLIAKKRHIEQGAMQELLKPKDGWVVKKLGEIFTFNGGYTASREQLSVDGYCYLHYGDIHGATKTFINVKSDYAKIPKLQIPLKKVSPKSLLNEGDIVFVDASEDDEGTSRHIVVKNPDGVPYISGLHTIVAKSKDDSVNNDYKRYCFQSAYIKSQFKFYAVGTKVSGISKTNILKIEISLPKLDEQTRIATILSDMDAEISALGSKLSKYKQVKQGMMQNLLTGKIRLV